jgi:predicted  nucleic acid-binding Zn-ribbon protein
VAIVATLAWLGGMIWLALPSLQAGLAPIALVEFIAALCVPPALFGIIWLLALRTSAAEARRFGRTAAAMRAEAASLERAIAVLSAHLDTNREQLADQTTALMAMGDAAAERLGAVRQAMAEEVAAADAQAHRLTEAVNAAQTNLGVLLSSLPRAHAETSEMAKTLASTGLTAGEHAAALDAQLVALADRGREADSVASGAAQKLAAHIARMEATSETAGARLESVTGEMSTAVDELLDRTASAVDEARKGIATQGEAMLAMLETNQAALDRATRDSVEALADRISAVEAIINQLGGRLREQQEAGTALFSGLNDGLGAVETRLAALHTQGVDQTQQLAASISALGGSADAMTETLKVGDTMARSVIATSEDLLLALDSAAREIDETLPDALARLDARIGSTRQTIAGTKPDLLALVTAAESTHDAIEAIAQVIAGQRTTIEQLATTMSETLDNGRSRAEALGRMMDETIGRTNDFAQEAAPKLVEALIRVRDTASAAAERARETLDGVIPEAAQSLGKASAEAMANATD